MNRGVISWWRRAAVLFLTLASAAMMAAEKLPPLNVPLLQGEVKLDGRLREDVWRRAAVLTETDFRQWKADTYERDPSRFRLRMFHDRRWLYVSLASYDRFVEPAEPLANSDGLYSLSLITAGGEILHFRLRWTANPPVALGDVVPAGQWGARLRGPFADTRREGAGYVFEFRIPKKRIGWRTGDRIPVNIIIHDHDGGPYKRYDERGVEFVRFAWGSMDNDDRSQYRQIRLAPLPR